MTVKPAERHPAPFNRELWLLLGVGAVLNLGVTLLGLWRPLWGVVLFADFVLLVLLAERLEGLVSLRYQDVYERVLAFGFPLLVLVVWELVVNAGLLNARWFPPPTKILRALWDLTVGYDRFKRRASSGALAHSQPLGRGRLAGRGGAVSGEPRLCHAQPGAGGFRHWRLAGRAPRYRHGPEQNGAHDARHNSVGGLRAA